MRVFDTATTYWKGRYNDLQNDLGPVENKDVNVGWMQSKGLRYGGKDGDYGGDFWVGRDGKVYAFDKRTGGSTANDSDNGTQATDNSDWQNYTPSGYGSNTNPVTDNAAVVDLSHIGNTLPNRNGGFPPGMGSRPASYHDLPRTAGITKFSKTSVQKTALNMPCVRQAMSLGHPVILHWNTTPGTGSSNDMISLAGGNSRLEPVRVVFTGDVDAYGQQVQGGRPAGFTSNCGDVAGFPRNMTADGAPVIGTISAFTPMPTPRSRNNTGSSNIGSNDDITYLGHVIGQSSVPGREDDVTSSAGVVTDTTGIASGSSSGQDSPAKNSTDDPCKKHSHLYLLDEFGNKPDSAAREFFDHLNARAGSIFQLCENGKVLLIEGKNPESVTASDSVSKILALTVNNGIEGGVGYNHAKFKHTVRIKVKDPDAEQTRENAKFNDDVYFDDYHMTRVDLADYRKVLNRVKNINPEKHLQFKANTIIQAAFMGHFICEIFSASLYNVIKLPSEKIDSFFFPYHSNGIRRECEIINEMARLSNEIRTRKSSLPNEYSPTDRVASKTYIYYLSGGGALLINIYVPVNPDTGMALWGIVINGEIYIDRNYKPEK